MKCINVNGEIIVLWRQCAFYPKNDNNLFYEKFYEEYYQYW